ncbi:MAG: HAD family phosphatase [Ruthenibacterium sp.]
MKTKAVLLDMDGLMFDTERLSDEVWLSLAERDNLGMVSADMLLLRGKNREAGKEAFLRRFGENFPFDDYCDEALAEITARLSKKVPLRPGLFELLDTLKTNHIPAAVASSTHRSLVESNLRVAGVLDFIKVIATGDEVAHSKPAPDIFLLAAKRLGVAPEECMVLEDSYNGVRAGAASGARTIMVPDMDMPTPETEQLADAIVPTLADVIPLL